MGSEGGFNSEIKKQMSFGEKIFIHTHTHVHVLELFTQGEKDELCNEENDTACK